MRTRGGGCGGEEEGKMRDGFLDEYCASRGRDWVGEMDIGLGLVCVLD